MADEDTEHEDTAVETDDDTTATEEADPKPADKPKPPNHEVAEDGRIVLTKEQHTLLTSSQAKSNREARERKEQVKVRDGELAALRKQLDDLTSANATDAEKALKKATEEAAAAAEAKWRPAVVAVRAETALDKAGCKNPDVRELLIGKIDRSKVELDESGAVTGGLDEQVEALKEKYPDMFSAPKPPRVPSAREVDAADKKPPAVPQTASAQLAARLGHKA